MSSLPFKLGIPVVDQIPAETGKYIVRAKNYQECFEKLKDLQNKLTENDLIKIYHLGFRPDNPVPNSKWFTEVHIIIGGAEEWMHPLNYIIRKYENRIWSQIAVGKRKEIKNENKG